jgi:signal peptidase I
MSKRPGKFFLLAFILLLTGSCVKPVQIKGEAMSPVLNEGDRVMLKTNVGELKRGEIISFRYPKDTSILFILRIVGLPGETLEIRAGKVLINNNLLNESYISEELNQAKPTISPKLMGNDQYFVMGDNRDNSSDSRYWGTVSKDLITGKYSFTYYSGK